MYLCFQDIPKLNLSNEIPSCNLTAIQLTGQAIGCNNAYRMVMRAVSFGYLYYYIPIKIITTAIQTYLVFTGKAVRNLHRLGTFEHLG